jgi:mannosyltransferase OCH1-like enzyme
MKNNKIRQLQIIANQIIDIKKKENIIKDNIRKKIIIQQKNKTTYPLKKFYQTIIPLNIFQTWHTKNLPPLMKKNVDYIKEQNPAFKHHLFDDDDCENFIKNNYGANILNAFNRLNPGAYKADLWRYCVLYKLGGIYLDIKYHPVNEFKFINLTENEHWVLDMDKEGIYNALMICKPGNPILLKAINQIVENIKTNFYGKNALEPTGPRLLGKYFSKTEKDNFDMTHDYIDNFNNRFIYYNNHVIFKSYNGYIEEHQNTKKKDHYSILWDQKQIYI